MVNELRIGYSHVTIDVTPVDGAGLGNYNATSGSPAARPFRA